jgi:hypothetical protein
LKGLDFNYLSVSSDCIDKSKLVFLFLQSGGTKSSQWKCSSNLEGEKHRDGNVPPIWREKNIAMETFLQSGGRKSS